MTMIRKADSVSNEALQESSSAFASYEQQPKSRLLRLLALLAMPIEAAMADEGIEDLDA